MDDILDTIRDTRLSAERAYSRLLRNSSNRPFRSTTDEKPILSLPILAMRARVEPAAISS
jgi:hypothetical protein